MIIIIRDGEVKHFSDHGNIYKQSKNLKALVKELKVYANTIGTTAADILNIDPNLVAENASLRQKNMNAERTLEFADRQLKRNAK